MRRFSSVRPLIRRSSFRTRAEELEGDWIWICLTALWQRWWPDRVCLELLDDRIQDGYRRQAEADEAGGARTWLRAWSEVMQLCETTGIHSISEFDDRFPLTQSLYNWSQDLELALWNIGLDDPAIMRARIALCAQALEWFPAEDSLMTENRRHALAQSWYAVGDAAQGEKLFQRWMEADPGWGWGWIGWSDCRRGWRERPGDVARAEEILRRGYAIPRVRDRADIAERLEQLCEESGRIDEARQLRAEVRRLRRQTRRTSVARSMEGSEGEGSAEVLSSTTTFTFPEEEGLPLASCQISSPWPGRFPSANRCESPRWDATSPAPAAAAASTSGAAAPRGHGPEGGRGSAGTASRGPWLLAHPGSVPRPVEVVLRCVRDGYSRS